MHFTTCKSVSISRTTYFTLVYPVLQDKYWSDRGEIVCIPVSDLTKEEITALYALGFDFDYIRSMNIYYIVCELR